MRILVDLLHPAHVHVFRHFIREMEAHGHSFFLASRRKDCALELLDRFGFRHHPLSALGRGRLALGRELLARSYRLCRVIRTFRPDALTGIMGPCIALAGVWTRTPAVIFYDTEFATQTNRFAYPLAHSVCTPDCYQGKVRGRHVTYAGYHELAYLHPARFTPDPNRLKAFGVGENDRYSLVRFVSWQAIHDGSEKGLSYEQKKAVIAKLEAHGRVFITSEAGLPDELARYRLPGPVDDIHHLMAYARMMVGESATMSSEAAVLGVPAVFIATTGRGYTDDEGARYDLVRSFREERFDEALAAIDDFFARDPRAYGQAARQRLLAEKIDVTRWMTAYFEHEFGN